MLQNLNKNNGYKFSSSNLPNLFKVTKSPIFVPESLITDIKFRFFLF